ncbi:MAG: sugar ABC transporter permease [Anaerolineae bacterium]|nr:sugar ABC transporter permease [Anaerolineae bacterium]
MNSRNNRAWLFVLPALLVVAINAFIPFITIINYSVQDILPGLKPIWLGLENYQIVLQDPLFRGAFVRQVGFSFLILLIEIPLGVLIATALPKRSWVATLSLIALGLPLLIPWNVVGIIWRVFTRSDLGLVPLFFNALGYQYDVALNPVDAYWTVVVMDVWHWTPLVILLCYAGLNAIPDAYYQAAEIDGASRWRTFLYVTLPRLRSVLTIAILLRFMDSFRIYSEVFMLTGGGPGTATTFLSDVLVRKAVGGFEFGYAAALSLVYFLVILMISYVFFLVLTHIGTGSNAAPKQAE